MVHLLHTKIPSEHLKNCRFLRVDNSGYYLLAPEPSQTAGFGSTEWYLPHCLALATFNAVRSGCNTLVYVCFDGLFI